MYVKNANKTKYRPFSAILSLIIVSSVIFMSGCSKLSSSGSKSLKIGVQGMTGDFNPFYAEGDADIEVVSQIYSSVQKRNSSDQLVNMAGNISYEYEDESKVKYTVSIKDDLYYSDGSNATIDDVIFWYYVLADASYDGPYSDFYLNDIEGLKEYYYDDADYAQQLLIIGNDETKLDNYIQKNYSDGIDVESISGIKRIDNYTCTVLFDSRNINAVSAINAFIVSKAVFSADYVKGSADKIKSVTEAAGCGDYSLVSYDSGEAKLEKNAYCSSDPAFTSLSFIDVEAKGISPEEAVKSGDIDIVTLDANLSDIADVTSDKTEYSIYNCDEYCSLFFNSATIVKEARQIMMGICDIYSVVDDEIGSYYSRLYRPISIRCKESPQVTNPYYSSSANADVLSGYITKTLNAYYCGSKSDMEYKILSRFSEELKAYGVTLAVNVTDEKGFLTALKSGKADVWLTYVPDGATCDKYDYYNSAGTMNYTGINNTLVDDVTVKIRTGTGFTDKDALVSELMEVVMSEAVELPLFQLQKVTVYNTDTIDSSCLSSLTGYDGYRYYITSLI